MPSKRGHFFGITIVDKFKQGAIINSMSEYKQQVERQRLLLEAEAWSKTVKDIHVHSLSSMWYDNRPQDTADGKSVTDVAYNSGRIERTLDNGKKVYFGELLTGNELIQEYQKKTGATVLK